MDTKEKTVVTVSATINAPVEKVWKYFTEPVHITKWCQASDDWHAPDAENDLREDGRFRTTMAARDGSASFDFSGVYTEVRVNKRIAYTIDDGRTVQVNFEADGDKTTITETFETENENPVEMQREGWQAILNNFRKYTEEN